ncbi:MAG: hypothetical protein WAP23_00955 [Candidatus Spechtbacterales bacterium]
MSKNSLDLLKEPIPYMDRLLGSDFLKMVRNMRDAENKIRNRLLSNRELFANKIRELNPKSSQLNEIRATLHKRLESVEKNLHRVYGKKSVHTASGLANILDHAFSLCPENLKKGFYIKESSALSLLQKHPPIGLMNYMGCRSLPDLLTKKSALDVIALSRHTEFADWQKKYHDFLSELDARDFDNRKITYILVDEKKYRTLLLQSKQPQKPWRVSHNKEAGVIICFTPDNSFMFRAPRLQYIAVFMHYFFETAYASLYYKNIASKNPDALGREVVKSITSHKDKFPFFHPNAYSENLFWKKAMELFHSAYPIEDARIFMNTLRCGEYIGSPNAVKGIVSLNMVDHIWNINLSGRAQPINSFMYHFREALWQDIFKDLAGFSEKEMDNMIIQNLGLGDMGLTKKILKS